MNNIKRYNIFIILSTIARNMVEIFSSVLLYKMGYSFREILLFFAILYFTGAVTSTLIIYSTKIIKPKYILILSSLIFSGSFYFMQAMNKTFINLVIFSIIYGIGSYSYHTLRHYYAIKSIDNHKKTEIGSILIFTNIAIIFSSLIASYIQSKLSLLVLAITVIIISIIAVIPLFKFDISNDDSCIRYQKIEKNKLKFFILEQAKVINISLQPLYLYLFIDDKIEFIGIFNVVLGISACIFIYYFVRKIDDKKYFKYFNMIFCLLLFLKLNVSNRYLILLIGFFEGLGIKMFEIVSAENIYNIKKNTNVKGYLVIVEIIFCSIRCIMCIIGYFINNIKIILYLSVALIFLVGFVKRENLK
ncbi:MAG: hypothetical protein ACI4VL_05590 [Bacilli bacterium]